MIRVRTLLAVAALTLVAAAVAARGGAPAVAAAAAGACPSLDDGVTVVVDFQHLGGGAATRCAPGDPDSGLAALAAAGFRVDQVANQPGFVCRIDGLPGRDAEDCGDTPPASAYWGYSHAERGGSWSYAGSGAHVYDPPVGSVEGWAFNGDGGSTRPTVPPPPPPEPEPEPEPSAEREGSSEPDRDPEPRRTPQPHTSSAAAGGATPQPTPEPTADDDRSAPAGRATRASPTASPTTTPTPSTAPGRASSGEVLAATPDPSPRAAPAATTGAGTPWPTAVATLAVAGLVGAGVALRRRSRRGEPT